MTEPLLRSSDDNAGDVPALTNCPHCDYSLATLPPQGVCPECGGHYDQRFIVLVGRGRGRFDTVFGGTWRGVALFCPALAFAIWMLADLRNAQNHPMALMFSVTIVLQLFLVGYARLFSPQQPGLQLWLAPQGVVQRVHGREVQQSIRVGQWLGVLYLPVIVAIGFGGGTWRGTILAALITLVIMLGLSVLDVWRKRRRGRGVEAEAAAARLGLMRWRQIDKTELRPLGPDRVRIRCETTRTEFGFIRLSREPVVDIEVSLLPSQADALRRQIEQWTAAAKLQADLASRPRRLD